MSKTGPFAGDSAYTGRPPLAVVTGGSGGIGQTILLALARKGYDTVTLSRNAPPRPDSRTGQIRHIPCDLANADDLARVAGQLVTEGRPVQVLIHCAGVIVPGPVQSMRAEDVQRQIAINLTAPILLTSQLLPLIPRGGHIVFINSLAAVIPLANSAVYVASKAALRSFALALTLETKSVGIAVSSIFPGAVDTPMLRDEMAQGGSVLNFVSPPARPENIAAAVMKALRHPGQERFEPAIDGLFGRLCMMFPKLLRLALPVLTWFGRRGSARACGRPPNQ
ncbi:SDR family NAD(P)-dependent oxidoreductase [Acetobacter fallax]|uniref:SDR family NAD(P)-dependent oxidoreductase n=1 Tax=Acetobacter fallax TaxID=1737473 RepID=A0ABX0KCP2_9PROT|nr:SDR family NAD(P)-dependent oxidoreductase [Acetobacter fallax]NHO31727.1 SDR family NAD(P)-dependent oxidoreductase [Acetobacter fallax]NHO35286.1 SDR family NAD(P)-dependent oxidoreductase [Acetobacter fallax]